MPRLFLGQPLGGAESAVGESVAAVGAVIDVLALIAKLGLCEFGETQAYSFPPDQYVFQESGRLFPKWESYRPIYKAFVI
jgi:hypothetical protein